MNTFLIRTFILATGTVAAFFLGGCGKESASARSSPLPSAVVQVQTVELTPFMVTEEIIGTVRPGLRASIEAKISGRIERMPVVQGQTVKAGELLAQLEVREVDARLEQAAAMRDQAERDLARLTVLLGQQAVTQSEFEAVEARTRVARAAFSEAETMLAYSKVPAPFDGVIVRKMADIGDLAGPGRALLEIEDPASMRFETDVPEALIGGLQIGTRMPLRIPAIGRELEACVSEIAPSGDPHSRTFLVKLDLPAVQGIRSGLFGRVAIPVAEGETLRVPASAVVQRGQLEMVFVVLEDRAQLRLVKTGKRIADQVEVISGLDPGERIVTEGAKQLRDGQPVEERRIEGGGELKVKVGG
jgi:RND family efflux transporter MFP subunit